MSKKYKIDIDDMCVDQTVLDLLHGVVADTHSLDLDVYANDENRVNVFQSTGNVLKMVFDECGHNVEVNKDTDTIGGEITISVVDAVITGEKLKLFTRCLESANSIEFTSFIDGHTEIGLIYDDLMVVRSGNHEN